MIQGEITSSNINKNNSVIGIHIQNKTKEIKNCQYANDSNLFFKNQASVINVLKFFKDLNKATITTINLEKTTVLPINTNITIHIKNNAPKITVKEQYETIKILGHTFNENLKYAYETDLEDVLEKMENHINKLSPRALSLYGKKILLNTLIMSKTLYLSNVFPLDAKTTLKIHKKIFRYLWHNQKSNLIARKTIFL